jgi:hypothetical protein
MFLQICLLMVATTAVSFLTSFTCAAASQDERALRTLEAPVDVPQSLGVTE